MERANQKPFYINISPPDKGSVVHERESQNLNVHSDSPPTTTTTLAPAGGLSVAWPFSVVASLSPRMLAFFKENDQTTQEFIEQGLFGVVFRANNPKHNCKQAWPIQDVNSPQLHDFFIDKVKRHPDYTKKNLDQQQLEEIALHACESFYARKKDQLHEACPSLARFVENHPTIDRNCLSFGEVRNVLINKLVEVRTLKKINEDSPLEEDKDEFRDVAHDCLMAMNNLEVLFTAMAYEPKGWARMLHKLDAKINELVAYKKQLNAPENKPTTSAGKELKKCLKEELEHQEKLLQAKKLFMDEIAQHDPFSEKSVAYSNLLWAYAAHHLIQEAKSYWISHDRAVELFEPSIFAAEFYIQGKESAYEKARTDVRVEIPNSKNYSKHPVVQGKGESVAFVQRQLHTIHVLLEGETKQLTSSTAIQAAWCKALNHNQHWISHARSIVAHREGVTRCYLSTITPACSVPYFEESYRADASSTEDGFTHVGVSSADRSNKHHPRNAKISQLRRVEPDGSETLMATFIGHGVLDMWELANGTERANANQRGAQEILQLALFSNQRIFAKAAKGKPVKLTHISVNLTTPASWYGIPFAEHLRITRDYQEHTYTKAQFQAFEDAIGPEHEIFFLPPGGDHPVSVSIDVITFSFGINSTATANWSSDFLGGWNVVDEHNYAQMELFIGELDGQHSETYVESYRPAGFIGSILDQLDIAIDRAEDTIILQQLATKLQQQTDLVRYLFLSQSYKQGNGDPAKMGREILALQVFAEQALEALDAEEAATSSKGCKSDKDRGGVVDVELKYKLITEDLGGVVIPDAKLEEQDQKNYMSVALTQFQTQQYSIGLPGSKTVDNLGTRVWNEDEQKLLTGLSAFTQE